MPSQIERSADRNFILRHLPVFPAVALELIDLIDRRASDVAVITRMLGRDPGLSAEVLRQANSALSSPRKTVSDLSDAVNRLGADQTCNVAMKAACRGLVSPALGRPELRSCWERCVASAILASALAPELGFVAGQAYTAGLLHDIGCLALVAVYPDRYLEALQNMRDGAGWLEAERQVFGVTHCVVGSWIVEEWKLPEELLDVVMHHHDQREYDASMVSLVSMASTLADLLQPHPMERLPWSDPAAYLETQPLEQPARILAAIEGAADRIKNELS